MVVVIGSGSNAYRYNPSDPSDTSNPAPGTTGQSIGPGGMGGGSFRPDSRPEDYGSATNQNQSGNNQNQQEEDRLDQVIQNINNKIKDKEDEKKDERSGYQKFLDIVMGSKGDTSVKKSSFEQSGKHPLRAQLDYLIGKYGDSVLDTEQGKVLMGYLSGVPVERGGGLGAFDSEEGTGGAGIDPNDPGEKVRRDLLEGIASGEYNFTMDDFIDPKIVDYMRGRDIKGAQELTPEQYFKFRQQLMAADPTAENQGYKDAFPFSSGASLGAMAERFMPGATAMSTLAGGILPERNMTGYQGFDEDPLAATFRALPESQDRASGIMAASSAPPAPPPVVPPVVPPAEDEVPENPILNPIMSQRDPFNLAKFYASLPQYTQQGVMSPSLMQYYRNLGLFPRV